MKPRNILILIIFIFSFGSCDKFLEENYYSGASIELQVSTESGFENLISACYVPTKVWYGKEYGWDLTTVGTDCWTYAGDADVMQNLAKFVSSFNNSWPGRLALVWTEFYKAINTCNTALKYMPDAAISDEMKVIREGEVRFLRALYYWHIVETWGDVAFYNEPIDKPELEMGRSDVDVFYTQIFEDLDIAVANLPETVSSSDYGRVTKWAALALRARTNLFWATEYMSGNCYNGKTYGAINGRAHYQQAIDDAQAVIGSGYFELYDNYSDIWLMENNNSADKNTESIWAINYSYSEYAIVNLDPNEYEYLNSTDPKPLSEREGGNHGHLMFGMRWFAVGGGSTIVMVKDDENGVTDTEPTRPFCRYMPTRFLIDLFDEKVDERFYGAFNTVFYANNPDTSQYPVWNETETLGDGTEEIIAPDMVGKYILTLGDTAFRMFKEPLALDEFYRRGVATPWFIDKAGHYYCLDISQMYEEDGTIKDAETNARRSYFDLSKWYDYTRTHNGQNQDIVGSQRGKRDFVVFRLSEMYYIIAEASLGSGNPQAAYNSLLEVANKRSYDGNGAAMLQAYGINGAGDITIDFILDDRAREFAGEQQRWFDLKRNGKTLERIRAHNPDAAPNIQEKHLIRPIPQIELDAILNKEDFESGWGIY